MVHLPRPKIAVFSGPTATIQNSEPLVTSNKAREKYGLPSLADPDGSPLRFDSVRAQRLAAPVTVYIQQFSAHPLEEDAAHLYAPPDGYVDSAGVFHKDRTSPNDIPAYEVTLKPEDGLYLLPYMARQADGAAWEDQVVFPFAPPDKIRQTFYPDASRIVEEIDRFGLSEKGLSNLLAQKADYDFFRPAPSGGYMKGLPAALRTDKGNGDIPPETLGEDFWGYRPVHLRRDPPMGRLALLTNMVQKAMASGKYAGGIWLEGSPNVEETIYWLNLLIDTDVPLAGNSAQRPHGAISGDGDRNIVDSVDYILSGIWKGEDGKDSVGAVAIMDEVIFSARDVQKADARPGGYVATGGHGGVVGSMGAPGPAVLTFRPARLHTYKSAVKITALPASVTGVRYGEGGIMRVDVPVKDAAGDLLSSAIPTVTLAKTARYLPADTSGSAEAEVDLLARIAKNLKDAPLAGFVGEGGAPFGGMTRSVGCRAGAGRVQRDARCEGGSRQRRGHGAHQPRHGVHLRHEHDGEQGASAADGVAVEVRRAAPRCGPPQSYPRRAQGSADEDRRIPSRVQHPLAVLDSVTPFILRACRGILRQAQDRSGGEAMLAGFTMPAPLPDPSLRSEVVDERRTSLSTTCQDDKPTAPALVPLPPLRYRSDQFSFGIRRTARGEPEEAHLKDFEYRAPRSLQEAVALLAEKGERARVLAGGTDLIVQMRAGRLEPERVVDAKHVPELNRLSFDLHEGLTIGAAVPCYRLYEDEIVAARYPALIDAATIVGGTQIQSRASIGGNLCNAAPSGDTIPALIVLGATALITGSGGPRTLPVEQVCTAAGRTALQPGEILVEIRIPPPGPRSGAFYLRFIPRYEMDIAVVGAGASVVLSDDLSTFVSGRVALGAVAPTPLAVDVNPALAGAPVGDAAIEAAAEIARQTARPITDMRGTVEQRRHLCGVLTTRALRAAIARARGEQINGQ